MYKIIQTYASCLFVCTIGSTYGSLDNPKLTYSGNVKMGVGVNKISLLSVAVGLPVRENDQSFAYIYASKSSYDAYHYEV